MHAMLVICTVDFPIKLGYAKGNLCLCMHSLWLDWGKNVLCIAQPLAYKNTFYSYKVSTINSFVFIQITITNISTDGDGSASCYILKHLNISLCQLVKRKKQ